MNISHAKIDKFYKNVFVIHARDNKDKRKIVSFG